jgi:hypothetical protein
MSSLALWIGGVVAVVASVYRLQRAHRTLSPGGTYLCLAVCSVGLAAVLVAPGTLVRTATFEPFPNATRLLGNALAMTGAFCVHGMLAHLALPPDRVRAAIRRQAVVLAVALVAMTALLASARLPTSTPDFVADNAANPRVLAYVVLFSTYIAVAAAQYMRLIHYYIRLSDRPWLCRGLTIVQVGAAIAIAWALGKTTSAAVVYATGTRLTIENPLSAILSAACVTLVALGSTMPTWGPKVAQPLRWAHQHHAYRALHPLWAALHLAFPNITQPTGEPGPDESHTIAWRLARRVVEIRDGLLLLAPYRDPAVGQAARAAAQQAGHPDPEAAGEAAELATALRAWHNGAPPIAPVPRPPQHQPDGLEAETSWLKRVARAYRTSITAGHDAAARTGEASEQR